MVGAALLTSCHVLNRVPMKSKEKTPYEEWIGRKPSLSYLRTKGCLAKVNVPINKKRKLAPYLSNLTHKRPYILGTYTHPTRPG
jgi:hypothetical protein